MRKSMLVMIAVLLVSALMISCNSDVSEGVSGGDSLAKVTVMSGTSKALTSVVSGSTDVEDLYWYYTATKTDGSLFITGQKTEKTFIGTFTEENSTTIDSTKNHGLKNADLGLFSTGDWTFSFWGYAPVNNAAPTDLTDLEPVYYQEGLAAKVSGTTNLTVTLAEGAGMGDATVVFSYTDNNTTSYPYWDYALASNKSLTLYVYKSNPDASPAPAAVASQTKTTESNGHVVFDNLSSINLSSGTQTLYFRVMYGTECVGSFDLGLNVKSGTTISVYGLIENLDSTYHVYVRTVNKTKAEATIISENVGKTITEGTDTTIANTDGTTSVVTSKSPQNAASSSTSTTTTGTTVTLPNIILDTDETTGQGTATVTQKTVSHDLTVDVKSEDLAPSAFAIEAADEQAGLTAVAGIDLTLVKTTTTKTTVKESAEANANTVSENTVVSTDVVDTFKNGNETVYVTIETYIAKGLSDVKVRYNGTLASGVASHVFDENYGTANAVTDTSDAAYGTGYDPGTGRLVFKTPHFSSFYVISKPVAAVYDGTTLVKSYGSLEDAFAAVNPGQTIKVLVNVDLKNQIFVNKGQIVTLDLNGKTISYSGTSITDTCLFVIHKGATLTIGDSSNTPGSINGGESTYGAIKITESTDSVNDGVAKLVVNSGNISGKYCAISGNGNNNRHNTEIVINGGNLTATNGTAIYHPQYGKLTITDGTITGTESAVELRSGILRISGGTLTATATPTSVSANGNGTTTVGAALAIAQHTTQKDIDVEITGGTFTGYSGFYHSNPQNNTTTNVSLQIKGGTFTSNDSISTDDITGVSVYSQTLDDFVRGGVYNTDPAAFVARGYVSTYDSTTQKWTVTKATQGVAKIEKGDYDDTDIFFSTVQSAVDAAETDETVCIIGEYTITSSISISKKINLKSSDIVYADHTGGNRAIRLVSGAEVSIVGGTWKAKYDSTGDNGSIFDVTAGKLIIQDGAFWGSNAIIGISGGEGYFYGGNYYSEDGGTCILVIGENAKAYVYGLNYNHVEGDGKGSGAVWASHGGVAYIYGGKYDFEPLTSENVTNQFEVAGTTYGLFDYRNYNNYCIPGTVLVYGGQFCNNFNPVSAYDGSENVNYLADGYTVEEVTIDNSTWYQVVKAPQQN